MIFEIAVGVALGIVLGAVTLRYWRQVLASSILLTIVLAMLAAFAVAGFFLWDHRTKVLAYVGAVVLLAVLYGVPFYLYGKAKLAYPKLGVLLKGEPPWNTVARLPARLFVMLIFSVTVAGIAIGGLVGSLWFIEYVAKFHAS